MDVEIHIDFADGVMELVKERVTRALQEVAPQVPHIIKDKAILENKDVDGNEMHLKQPRPPKNPRNFPNLPLIQNDEPDLMSNDRWQVEIEDGSATITYIPPEHLQYLIEKAPERGGRPWILPDRINEEAREEIEELLRAALEE
ncbi:MAG: hypothetical protein JWP44_4128 [Mucilaginibacter sp.]|nr:hypothetical protein [Mucilaginibacter sp.]